MKIIDIDIKKTIYDKKNYIALGNFDGLHKAHQNIINRLIKKSKEDKVQSSILLFKSHSQNVLLKEEQKVLTSLEQKFNILKFLGIDNVFVVDFQLLRNFSPNDFVELLLKKLGVVGIFVGYDYKFGKFASGNIDFLKSHKNELGFYLDVAEPILDGNITISSTYIKELISKNNLLEAEELLGRKYFLSGKVVFGKKLGSKLGFPTANIELDVNYILPSEGVYFTEIIINSNFYYAATSLGRNITLEEREVKIEANILNFNREIYGEKVSIRFIKQIRPMIKFSNISDLTSQVKHDIKIVESMINRES